MKPGEVSRRLYARGLSRSTVNDYTAAIMAADSWCRRRGWTLRSVPGPVLYSFFDTLPPSWASRKRYRSALTHYWKITRRPAPPVGVLPVPRKPKAECRALSPDDARLLHKTALRWDGPEGVAVLLGLHMALRRFEVAKIHRRDLRDDGQSLRVLGKGGSLDTLPIPSVLRPVLRHQWAVVGSDFLFPGRWPDKPVAPMTISNYVKRVADEAGVACSSHQLRHTALATLNDESYDLRDVMEFARHRDPATTLTYTRTKRSKLEAMGESLGDLYT